MTAVRFKSLPKYWHKERDGRKPNTVRFWEPGDERFNAEAGDKIVLINTETGEEFRRVLTDVSIWEQPPFAQRPLVIFSWRK